MKVLSEFKGIAAIISKPFYFHIHLNNEMCLGNCINKNHRKRFAFIIETINDEIIMLNIKNDLYDKIQSYLAAVYYKDLTNSYTGIVEHTRKLPVDINTSLDSWYKFNISNSVFVPSKEIIEISRYEFKKVPSVKHFNSNDFIEQIFGSETNQKVIMNEALT